MGQAYRGAAAGRFKGDGDDGIRRRHRLALLPAPGEHHALAGFNLGERAGGVVPRRNGPAVLTAHLQVDAGCNGLPAAEAFRLGNEGKSLVDIQREKDGLVESHDFSLGLWRAAYLLASATS